MQCSFRPCIGPIWNSAYSCNNIALCKFAAIIVMVIDCPDEWIYIFCIVRRSIFGGLPAGTVPVCDQIRYSIGSDRSWSFYHDQFVRWRANGSSTRSISSNTNSNTYMGSPRVAAESWCRVIKNESESLALASDFGFSYKLGPCLGVPATGTLGPGLAVWSDVTVAMGHFAVAATPRTVLLSWGILEIVEIRVE